MRRTISCYSAQYWQPPIHKYESRDCWINQWKLHLKMVNKTRPTNNTTWIHLRQFQYSSEVYKIKIKPRYMTCIVIRKIALYMGHMQYFLFTCSIPRGAGMADWSTQRLGSFEWVSEKINKLHVLGSFTLSESNCFLCCWSI